MISMHKLLLFFIPKYRHLWEENGRLRLEIDKILDDPSHYWWCSVARASARDLTNCLLGYHTADCYKSASSYKVTN